MFARDQFHVKCKPHAIRDWSFSVIEVETGSFEIFIEPLRRQSDGTLAFLDFDATEFAERLDEELEEKRVLHIDRVNILGLEALFSYPLSEPEPNLNRVLMAITRLWQYLGEQEVPLTWKTRSGLIGALPKALGAAWEHIGNRLELEIEIPSIEDKVVAQLTPGEGGPVSARLRLIRAMRKRGAHVILRLAPLVPMINDGQQSLEAVMGAAKEAGATGVEVRYLTMLRGKQPRIWSQLSRMQREMMRSCFARSSWEAGTHYNSRGRLSGSRKMLPAEVREQGHRRAKEIAAQFGLRLIVPNILKSKKSTRPESAVSIVPSAASLLPQPAANLNQESGIQLSFIDDLLENS